MVIDAYGRSVFLIIPGLHTLSEFKEEYMSHLCGDIQYTLYMYPVYI